ncbi:MAG: RNA-directed DNA polymerase [Lachnospiraceae bacterium]|nr:RNA-directed DNA polymerase [Lachnospiraceae bacterium]
MPYITVRQRTEFRQITFEELILGIAPAPTRKHTSKGGTITRYVRNVDPSIRATVNMNALISSLERFNNLHQNLFDAKRESLYRTFYIPKKTGGLRRIDAPNDELMDALRELKTIFTDQFGALHHTSAFAYVENRSPVDAIKRHQVNGSRWFLKTDFSNFFGSTTEDFLYTMVSMIFPFSEVIKSRVGKEELKKALSLCFLNGGLPQGTPISPMLTNLMMIPFDHKFCNELSKKGFVYTRYADDIQISNEFDFNYHEIVQYISDTLKSQHAPFVIKPQKTRYGSSSGRNWNLGVMLNKEGDITVGHEKKKVFKAMVNNFIVDTLRCVPWSIEDVRHMDGLLSYYKMVEPDYFDHIIKSFNEKYKVDYHTMVRAVLKGK